MGILIILSIVLYFVAVNKWKRKYTRKFGNVPLQLLLGVEQQCRVITGPGARLYEPVKMK